MLSCYSSTIIGLGLLVATFVTMTVSKEQHQALRKGFSPELEQIYENIVSERRNLYFQGLVLGLVVSFFASQTMHIVKPFHKIAFFLAVTLTISVAYYSLMPKTDYMLHHLKTQEENKAWLNMYKTMKGRYMFGFVLGTLSAVPIAYSLC